MGGNNHQTLESVYPYVTSIAFLCDICSCIVLRGKPAVLLTFSYEDVTYPVYWDEDNSRFLKFVRCCEHCGEVDNV
jgi:hypothetical protein